jgi:pimeloyl-ACP methyl ester carboxylesterase
MRCYDFIIIFLTSIFFTGCIQLKELKQDLSLSYYSQKQNQVKDTRILDSYMKNFEVDKITTINNSIFLKKHGKVGLWLPYKFIDEIGGGIYFLDVYDKEKTPILFVHGAGGNGIEWNYMINNIDQNKYQPIVVSYPSGVKLEVTVDILSKKLEKIITKYKMKELIIIAHSMGGLVSKSLIRKINKKRDLVKTFITLSTPWKGHEGASNTKDLPYYIPSWLDMQPKSEFISSIKDKNILTGVNHYLLFGYKGSMTLYGRDNDGTISLKSQLEDYAQNDARKIFGFNETHTSILVSEKVIKNINLILKLKF